MILGAVDGDARGRLEGGDGHLGRGRGGGGVGVLEVRGFHVPLVGRRRRSLDAEAGRGGLLLQDEEPAETAVDVRPGQIEAVVGDVGPDAALERRVTVLAVVRDPPPAFFPGRAA